MQNDTQAMVIDLLRQVGRMLLVLSKIVADFGQALIVTAFPIHVLNAIDGAAVFVLVVVLEFDGFGEGADDVSAEAFDIKDVAGPDVSMVDFFFVQEVERVHEVDEDFEFFLSGPWPFGEEAVFGDVGEGSLGALV
jgi:hypothetical protein